MIIIEKELDLSKVDEKLKPIVEVLLKREQDISDGFGFYCGFDSESVLLKLEEIAREIMEAIE